MRAVIAILVLAAIAVGAWLARERWMPDVARAPENRNASTAPAPPPARVRSEAESGSDEPEVVARTMQREAERYVATLTEAEPVPVQIERADHFVTGDQMLALVPRRDVELTSVAEMRSDPSLEPDAPITVVREVEQVERVTPEKLIARSAGNLDAPITVLERDVARHTTVRDVLERARREPHRPVDIIIRSEFYEQTTLEELATRDDLRRDQPLRVVRSAHGLETASVVQLMLNVIRSAHGLETASVAQLMREARLSADSLFYVRAVRPDDSQGLWGIVHDGIIENFARGMAIRRGRAVNTYRVQIPRDADERRDDRSSSFLGKLIHEKTRASYVYNFERGRMGRNPDRIFPGQEIVIIAFQPDELIRIYKHFVAQRG
jgi:hypothetical protein